MKLGDEIDLSGPGTTKLTSASSRMLLSKQARSVHFPALEIDQPDCRVIAMRASVGPGGTRPQALLPGEPRPGSGRGPQSSSAGLPGAGRRPSAARGQRRIACRVCSKPSRAARTRRRRACCRRPAQPPPCLSRSGLTPRTRSVRPTSHISIVPGGPRRARKRSNQTEGRRRRHRRAFGPRAAAGLAGRQHARRRRSGPPTWLRADRAGDHAPAAAATRRRRLPGSPAR